MVDLYQKVSSLAGSQIAHPAFFGPSKNALFSELSPVHPVIVSQSLIESAKREGLRAKPANKALSEAERYRLVRTTKSQTKGLCPKSKAAPADLIGSVDGLFVGPLVHSREMVEPPKEEAHQRVSKGPGQYTVVQFREWSEEYRVRTRIDIAAAQPQAPEGERISKMLSNRGARNIADSCHYMALKHGGYKTFVTGTFSNEKRAEIEAGNTTIQKEVTRAMDALKKMYLRGWNTSEGEKVDAAGPLFSYCWVVEIPKNEDGTDNPHVHMMIDWRVDYRLFAEWSGRIERIWGNGYFHLEKIKDPECAGAYMAKAAGYLTKGEDDGGQGVVKGNRYGISKPARAPGWCSLGDYELGVMGKLIHEVHDHMTRKYGSDFRERKRLNQQLSDTPKGHKSRQKIGERLQKVRAKLNALPVRASKYQIVCKGQESFNKFLGWVTSAGWDSSTRPDSIWFAEFKRQQAQRQKRSWWNRLSASFAEMSESVEMIGDLLTVYGDDLNRVEAVNDGNDWGEYERLGLGLV